MIVPRKFGSALFAGLSLLSGVSGAAVVRGYSMQTVDGRRMTSRMEGTNEVFSLVARSELPADMPPVRPWRHYVVKATHTDIGLHNSQYVQRHGTVKRIEDAMRLVDADGTVCPHADTEIDFGPQAIATCSGDLTDNVPATSSKRKTWQGRALGILVRRK